jgi:competence protein ComEC
MQTDPPIPAQSAAGVRAVPLFHAAWLFALGIAAASRLWLRPSLLLIALALVVVLFAISALSAQRIRWLPFAVFWILFGAWCAEMEPHPAPSQSLTALSDGLLRTVEGTVTDAGPMRNESEESVDEPNAPTPSQRIDVRVSSVEEVTDAEDAQSPVTGGVRLTVRWPVEAVQESSLLPFHCGERIRASVRLLLPETYHDAGVWSREHYLLEEGITSSATVAIARVARLGVAPGSYLRCRLNGWQHDATNRLLALPAAMQRVPAALRLTKEDAAMLAAMVDGDRTYLTQALRVGFERTGSFHMLVISGFHLAIVAGCIFWIARRLRMPRVPATLITIAASFAYALFTGFALPVQRSLCVVTIYLLGRLVYRERNALNTIGFAALCLLAVSPRSLFDSSLQMTLLAVVAIAGVAVPLLASSIHPYVTAIRDLQLIAIDIKLEPRLAQFRVMMRMIAAKMQPATSSFVAWRLFPWAARYVLRVVELLVIALVVELAMSLPMAIYFHRITLFALPVNLFILPLLFVLMPLALLTLVALVAWPAAAVVPAMGVAAALHIGVGLVRLFGSLSLGDFRIATPLLWQSAAFCILFGAAILLAHRGLISSDRSAGQLAQRLAWASLLAAAVVGVLPRNIDRPSAALLLQAIDVGQGDSLLLITPDGKTLLVDGGGFGGDPRQSTQDFDIGEEVVSEALWSRGIRHLDAVALSHAHSDHMGGLPAVLRNFHPDELWVGNNPHSDAYDALIQEAAELQVHIRSFRAGDAFAFDSTQINVLAPFSDYQPGPEASNNDSLVMHVAYGATSVMLEGDAEAPIENAMLAEPDLKSALLKVGHHGSTTSTQSEFLARVSPQWAVISSGVRNRYGHPREEVLEELQAAQVRTYRTDIHGASCFVLDGKTVTPDSECGWRSAP